METKEYTCIVCPLSCHIVLKVDNEKIVDITGYTCNRGKKFAKNEYNNPVRTLTTVVKLNNSDYDCLPVISDGGIPKSKLNECLKVLKKVKVEPPVTMGDIIVEDLLSTNVNIVSAKSVKERR